jgi:hypothetical protein
MSNVISFSPASEPSDEQRLNDLDLSSSLFHTALTPGASRARNRTALALRTTPGNDIYHDTMEELALMLTPQGWQPVVVDGQPRLMHPQGTMSFTLASAINVAHPDRRKSPRTRGKGPATRSSLAAQPPQELSLFDLAESIDDTVLVEATRNAPFWMLLHERTSTGLNLEFARPSVMTAGGTVTDWVDNIAVPPLELDGDLSVFDNPDNDDDFDVPVVRL